MRKLFPFQLPINPEQTDSGSWLLRLMTKFSVCFKDKSSPVVPSLEGQLNLSMVSEYYCFTAVIVPVTFYRLPSNTFFQFVVGWW